MTANEFPALNKIVQILKFTTLLKRNLCHDIAMFMLVEKKVNTFRKVYQTNLNLILNFIYVFCNDLYKLSLGVCLSRRLSFPRVARL